MNMTDTLKGSYFAEVFPKGWDIEKIADCVSQPPGHAAAAVLEPCVPAGRLRKS